MDTEKLLPILHSYLTTALWSSHWSENGCTENLDDNFTQEDCSVDFIVTSLSDIIKFLAIAGDRLDREELSQVVHDFWLTRNGHGAGFWDGDYPKYGDSLTKIVEDNFKSVDLYVGDDEVIYHT